MKKAFFACLAALCLLAGCGVPQESTEPTPPAEIPAVTSPILQGCYQPGSAVEIQTGGAVRLYTPEIPNCEGIAALGDNLLLFSGSRLSVLAGEDLHCIATSDVSAHVDPLAYSTRVTPEGIAYFDPVRREMVLLDETLREILRLSAPEGMTDEPILSRDRMTLYYSTGDSICALDLDTRIPRTIRQFSGSYGSVVNLILEDSVLVCVFINDEGALTTQFLSAQTGQLLEQWDGTVRVATDGDHYQASLMVDTMPTLVFGAAQDAPQTLHSHENAEATLLPRSRGVLEVTSATPLVLEYYDLSTGLLRSTLTLEGDFLSAVADGGNGTLWLMIGDSLYRWDTAALPTGDNTVYTGTYFTRSNPDLNGIARCQALAEEIGSRHGVKVLVWEDAIAVQPWDYHLTEEYLVPILLTRLEALDRQLSNFPDGFLTKLTESFQGLSICLVRQLQGTMGDITLDQASGLQFWVENHGYIALSTIHSTEGSLYHEMSHVLDTRVFTHSNAYDQWEALNPSGFTYDYDYAANASRNAGEYLRDAERCFIDTYSMSFPKEDRARILEYAMTEGNEHYFQSKTMQNKLRQICIGLRDAFGLKKSPDTFLWEQYLQEPLAYTK